MKPKDILHAMTAYAKASLGKTAEPQEIQRRSSICMTCPVRQPVSGLDANASKLLSSMVINNKAPRSLSDSMCGACGCSLMLLVPADLKDIHEDLRTSPDKSPRHKDCWIINE